MKRVIFIEIAFSAVVIMIIYGIAIAFCYKKIRNVIK